MIDKELQLYYESRFAMFSTKGWNDLLEDAERMSEAIADINTVKDEKELHFRKGQLDILKWLSTLKQVSEEAYQELKDEGTV